MSQQNDSYFTLSEVGNGVLEDFPYFKSKIKLGLIDVSTVRVFYKDILPHKISALVDGKCLKEFSKLNGKGAPVVFYNGTRMDVAYYE